MPTEFPPVPEITTPGPNRNAPDNFSAEMDTFIIELPDTIGGMNDLGEWMYDTAVEVAANATAASGSATAADGFRASAQVAAVNSDLARAESADILDSNQVIAAAVQSAAGLPSLAGNGLKFLQAQAGEGGVQWATVPEFAIEPGGIFAAGAEDRLAWPGDEYATIGVENISPGASTGRVFFTNGLYCVCHTNSNANCRTSPDGVTWTNRAMPSTGIWALTDTGAGNLLAAKVGTTDVAKSTDGGLNWSLVTSMPAGAGPQNSNGIGRVGNRILVRLNNTTSYYYTDDEGATWSAVQNAPSNITSIKGFPGIGLFFVDVSGGSYLTSPTGATGSWTSRTKPGGGNTLGQMHQNIDGTLFIPTNSRLYESVDGISWTEAPIPPVIASTPGAYLKRNGVYFSFPITSIFGENSLAFSFHSGIRTPRLPGHFGGPVLSGGFEAYAVNGSGLYVGSAGGSGVRFTLAQLDAAQGYFVEPQ